MSKSVSESSSLNATLIQKFILALMGFALYLISITKRNLYFWHWAQNIMLIAYQCHVSTTKLLSRRALMRVSYLLASIIHMYQSTQSMSIFCVRTSPIKSTTLDGIEKISQLAIRMHVQ